MMEAPTFIKRVRLRNYRSIASCSVTLSNLALLVGPNGSGKSNFVDALRLVSESLQTSLEHALQDRGGIHEVRRRSSGHPTHFAIALDLELNGIPAAYRFEVGAVRGGGFRVSREQCFVGNERYEVRDGELHVKPAPVAPPASPDRLYLVNASGLPTFRPLYDALSTMGFYNIQPERIRELQTPDKGELLHRDGGNLASVVRSMKSEAPEALGRAQDFLRAVVPGIEGFSALPMGHMMTLEFRQRVAGSSDPWKFPAITMSDGTLRATALLVALFQPRVRASVPLVAIEEPETALHPAAAGVLFDSLRAATRHTQVLATSHSPDLLDHPSLDPDEILAVHALDGRTVIGPLDEASRSAMLEQLFTGGELLRAGGIEPADGAEPNGQLRIFEGWKR